MQMYKKESKQYYRGLIFYDSIIIKRIATHHYGVRFFFIFLFVDW